jgi:hypothetical protein
MLLILSLFGLFCLVIILVRLNFSINQTENSEIRTRIQAVWNQVMENNIKRRSFYQKFEEILNAYKTNKDHKIYNEQRKKLENELKLIQQDFTTLQTKIKTDSAEAAQTVRNLNIKTNF